jgi:adenine-specific DNA-methyltransferase
MARKNAPKRAAGAPKRVPKAAKRKVEPYEHTKSERVNNPPVGLVSAENPDGGRRTYSYDPHLDPQLVWAGKAEHTSFDVPTVSLHVHERIEPRTIIEAVRKANGGGLTQGAFAFFDREEQNPPLREAIDFYRHRHGWSNRLIAGDSLLVMNSLLEKEGMAGKVQIVYFDPPYGIKYGSNFQPFVNKRDVKDGNDQDLTAEPEMIKAFRDMWELGIHSYLAYLRDRLLLARELLHESGSVFVQIGDENVHLARNVLDEVLGVGNAVSIVQFAKTSSASSELLPGVADYVLWYARDKTKVKYRPLYAEKVPGEEGASKYDWIELPNGNRRLLTAGERAILEELPRGSRVFTVDQLTSQRPPGSDPFTFQGQTFVPVTGDWKTSVEGLNRLAYANRVVVAGNRVRYVRFLDDFPVFKLNNIWTDIGSVQSRTDPKVYVVQTATSVAARCMLMCTDPGDLALDPTCGSGTTAYVAEQWGRRWITCDTSRVALTLAKTRLMTAVFDYYQLAHPDEGVGSGFKYKTVPHVTLKSIANNPEIQEGMTREEIDRAIAKYAETETLYDQPLLDRNRARVTGPFTVEAVPAPMAVSLGEVGRGAGDGTASGVGAESENQSGGEPPHSIGGADSSIARSGATLRHAEWRDELLKTGVRGKGGQRINFARLEPLGACRWLAAEGETRGEEGAPGQRVVVAFGPEHAALEQRQVARALEEANTLVPKPRLLIFAAFQFDPEAAKDIDETNWPGVTLLKAQMNADLLTDDLKKKRSSNDAFWLIGQPDVRVERIEAGDDAGKLRVHVEGFDYFNTRTGAIESGGKEKIAVWMLDTDYDGRSLFPRQVFLPMAGDKEG